MSIIKDIGSLLIGIGILIAGCGFSYGYVQKIMTGNLGGGVTTGQVSYQSATTGGITGGIGMDSATTTEFYLHTNDTASSTIIGFLEGSKILTLDVQARASSSAATLGFAVDVSRDKIDWNPISEATSTTNSQMLVQVGESQHLWGLATTSTNYVRKHFTLPVQSGKYYRVRFGVSGANTALWAAAAPQTDIPN